MPDPFIDQQDLSDYLGINVTADDGALIAIDAACDICRDEAERLFNRGTVTLALDGTGTDALLIPNEFLPVNSAGTITVAGTAETGYMVTRRGELLRGTAGCYPRPVWPEGRQNVTVTVDYGYDSADIPRSVRMVALSVAARLAVQGVAAEETVGDVRVKYAAAATDLTAGERRILKRYRGIR